MAQAPTSDYSVEVDDVSMVFNMASQQLNNLKEYFIAAMRHELYFKEFRALDHVSFKVRRGEVVGLLGTNGSGKSTMLKCIAGVLEPTEGRIVVRGNIAPLIELGAGFDPELTARENIYLNGSLLGYTRSFIDEHLDDIVEFAELADFMDMPLKNYSSGMVARIAFAIATVTEPDVLIVDETLSVGDVFFQHKCEERIQRFISSGKVTVLFVSHSIEQVERICQRAVWIEKGHRLLDGPVAEVCDLYRGGAAGVEMTRERFATTLWRYAGSPESSGDLSAYTDASDLSDDGRRALCWAVEHGIMHGYGSTGVLGPQDTATRPQIEAMIDRYNRRFEGASALS